MDSELDRRNPWDDVSTKEFDQFLDDWHAAQEKVRADEFQRELERQKPAQERDCPVHGRF